MVEIISPLKEKNEHLFFMRPATHKTENNEISDEKENGKGENVVKGYLVKAITTSTLHRLGSIYELESRSLKLILSVLFLISTGYCVYEIVVNVIIYLQFSVLTTTSINYEIPAEFPG
jgi:hypothetical protein